jgi:hypothetical protein
MKGAHMSETTTEKASRHPPLGVSERVSIINALMAQDRIEIRERQEAVFRLTYYVVPGLIGIAAFSVGRSDFRGVLILGQILLLGLYVAAFFTFRKWLADSRAYQQIRESFYKQQERLYSEPFTPMREIKEEDRVAAFQDNALWFPFGVTVVSAVVLLAYLLLKQQL